MRVAGPAAEPLPTLAIYCRPPSDTSLWRPLVRVPRGGALVFRRGTARHDEPRKPVTASCSDCSKCDAGTVLAVVVDADGCGCCYLMLAGGQRQPGMEGEWEGSCVEGSRRRAPQLFALTLSLSLTTYTTSISTLARTHARTTLTQSKASISSSSTHAPYSTLFRYPAASLHLPPPPSPPSPPSYPSIPNTISH